MRKVVHAIVPVLFIMSGCATNGLDVAAHSAADFSLPALDGRQITLSQLKGKVVVLDFWATWCPPCREGLPHLQSLASNPDMAQRGLVVLAIDQQEKAPAIGSFLDQGHYLFTVLRDADGSTARAFDVSALPTTIVIGRDGVVQAAVSGWTPDTSQKIDEAVAKALVAPIR